MPADNLTIVDLYDEFETDLRRFAMSLAHDSFRADDLVQDTFMKAMANVQLLGILNSYQRRAWLIRTLKNRFLDEQKIWKRRDEILADVGKSMDWQVRSPENFVGENPWELIPEEYQELFRMRYEQGLNSQEIARKLDVPAATIRSRLHLAKKKIEQAQNPA